MALTSRAVAAGTREPLGQRRLVASSEETPVCSTIGATRDAAAPQPVTSSAVNGRPALGISALPGSVAKTVW